MQELELNISIQEEKARGAAQHKAHHLLTFLPNLRQNFCHSGADFRTFFQIWGSLGSYDYGIEFLVFVSRISTQSLTFEVK